MGDAAGAVDDGEGSQGCPRGVALRAQPRKPRRRPRPARAARSHRGGAADGGVGGAADNEQHARSDRHPAPRASHRHRRENRAVPRLAGVQGLPPALRAGVVGRDGQASVVKRMASISFETSPSFGPGSENPTRPWSSCGSAAVRTRQATRARAGPKLGLAGVIRIISLSYVFGPGDPGLQNLNRPAWHPCRRRAGQSTPPP